MFLYKEIRIFADVIKLQILRWKENPGFSGCALNAITKVLIRERGKNKFQTDTHNEGDAKTEQREI